MGFGFLLTGYFFVSVIALFSPLAFVMLAGYPMMIFGLYRLAPYHKYLRVSFYASFFSLPFAVYYAVHAFSHFKFAVPAFFSGQTAQTVEWLYFSFVLVFSVLWISAVAMLCRELVLAKLLGNAWRNLIILGATALIDLFVRLPIPFVQSHQGYFAVPVLLLRFIIVFLNCMLVFGCYRIIRPEGEIVKREVPQKKEDRE